MFLSKTNSYFSNKNINFQLKMMQIWNFNTKTRVDCSQTNNSTLLGDKVNSCHILQNKSSVIQWCIIITLKLSHGCYSSKIYHFLNYDEWFMFILNGTNSGCEFSSAHLTLMKKTKWNVCQPVLLFHILWTWNFHELEKSEEFKHAVTLNCQR